jgi:hypothetical protein
VKYGWIILEGHPFIKFDLCFKAFSPFLPKTGWDDTYGVKYEGYSYPSIPFNNYNNQSPSLVSHNMWWAQKANETMKLRR